MAVQYQRKCAEQVDGERPEASQESATGSSGTGVLNFQTVKMVATSGRSRMTASATPPRGRLRVVELFAEPIRKLTEEFSKKSVLSTEPMPTATVSSIQNTPKQGSYKPNSSAEHDAGCRKCFRGQRGYGSGKLR